MLPLLYSIFSAHWVFCWFHKFWRTASSAVPTDKHQSIAILNTLSSNAIRAIRTQEALYIVHEGDSAEPLSPLFNYVFLWCRDVIFCEWINECRLYVFSVVLLLTLWLIGLIRFKSLLLALYMLYTFVIVIDWLTRNYGSKQTESEGAARGRGLFT